MAVTLVLGTLIAMGLNPFGGKRKPSDIVFVVAALIAVVALLTWALFGG